MFRDEKKFMNTNIHLLNRLQNHWLAKLLVFLMILSLQFLVLAYYGEIKSGFHIDEMFSYGLSNAIDKPIPLQDDLSLYNRWIDSEYFKNYIVVSEHEKFSYQAVYHNQTQDVHPPFYYMVLHTLCSFFPGTFSKWYGLSLNIVFFMISNLILFLISKKIFNESWLSLIPPAIWGFSIGAVNSVLFIRMYALLLLFVLFFCYLHLLLIEQGGNKKRWFCLSLCVFLGFMTHYFFLVFAFFVSLLYCIYQLTTKKYKEFFQYSTIMMSTVVAGFLFYPAAYTHIIKNPLGLTILDNLVTHQMYSQRLQMMYDQINSELFAEHLHIILSILLVFLLFGILSKKLFYIPKTDSQQTNSHPPKTSLAFTHINFFILLLTIACLLYFLLVTKIVTLIESRYLYCIFPLAMLLISYYTWKAIGILYPYTLVIFGCLLVIFGFVCFTSYVSYESRAIDYLYLDRQDNLSIAQKYKNYDCVFILNHTYQLTGSIGELSEFKKIYIMKQENIPHLTKILKERLPERGIVIFIDYEYDLRKIRNDILNQTNYVGYQYLFQSCSSAYFFY